MKTEKSLNNGFIYMNPVKWKPKKKLDVNLQILTISCFHILKHKKGLIHIELHRNFSDIQKRTLVASSY